MRLLDMLPAGNVLLWLVSGALAAALAYCSVVTMNLEQARTALAVEQRDHASEIGRMERASRDQVERFRTTEKGWLEAQRKVVDVAEQKIAQARADAVLADAARGRLQQHVAALAAAARRATANSAAAGPSAPAEDAAGMLAELQRRADERAGILARIADARGAAGELCERSYDALTPSRVMPPARPIDEPVGH